MDYRPTYYNFNFVYPEFDSQDNHLVTNETVYNNTQVVFEDSMIYYNPITNKSYPIAFYEYDYSSRYYNIRTGTDPEHTTGVVNVFYHDDYCSIQDSTGYYKLYYLSVTGDGSPDSPAVSPPPSPVPDSSSDDPSVSPDPSASPSPSGTGDTSGILSWLEAFGVWLDSRITDITDAISGLSSSEPSPEPSASPAPDPSPSPSASAEPETSAEPEASPSPTDYPVFPAYAGVIP